MFCAVMYTNISYISSLLHEHFTTVPVPARFPCNSPSPTWEQNLLSLPGCERPAHLPSSKIAWCLLGSTHFTVEWRYSVALKSPLGQLPNLNNRNCWAWKAAELLILVWTTGESRLAAKDKTYLSAHTHTYTHTYTHTLSSRPRVNTHLPSLLWVW